MSVITPLVGGAAQAFHDDQVVSGSEKGKTNQGCAPMDGMTNDKTQILSQ